MITEEQVQFSRDFSANNSVRKGRPFTKSYVKSSLLSRSALRNCNVPSKVLCYIETLTAFLRTIKK